MRTRAYDRPDNLDASHTAANTDTPLSEQRDAAYNLVAEPH